MKSCRRPRDRKLAGEIAGLKIRDEKNDRAAGHDFVQVAQSERGISAPALRLEIQDFANESQGVRAAFLRRDVKLDRVGEEQQADLVVIPDRAEGEETCNLSREFALRLCVASEISRGTYIDHEQHRQLTFLGEFLHERRPESRGHVPVDRADFIARLILADLIEVHPAAFENAVVIAGKNRLHETFGLDFERADLLQNVRGCLVSSSRAGAKRSRERTPWH